MARRAASAGQMIDRFTYSPGDGYRYVWAPGRTVIEVQRITITDGQLTFEATDTIDVSDVPEPVTATAMSARVWEWKSTHP